MAKCTFWATEDHHKNSPEMSQVPVRFPVSQRDEKKLVANFRVITHTNPFTHLPLGQVTGQQLPNNCVHIVHFWLHTYTGQQAEVMPHQATCNLHSPDWFQICLVLMLAYTQFMWGKMCLFGVRRLSGESHYIDGECVGLKSSPWRRWKNLRKQSI